jgi:hypothetical protein
MPLLVVESLDKSEKVKLKVLNNGVYSVFT